MAFFTGKGDGGTSKLFDSEPGQRVSKTSPVFETLGMLDELNSLVGWCKAAVPKELEFEGRKIRHVLHDVQDHLFTIQAEVAGAVKSIPLTSVEHLGVLINRIESSLPPVKSFLLRRCHRPPGTTRHGARGRASRRATTRHAARKWGAHRL